MSDSQARGHVELPDSTSSPLYFALGLALILAGLVTNVIVSVVGVGAAVLGAIGWFRQVLPVEHEHEVDVSDPVPEVRARAASVEHLTAGEASHRVRLPAEYHPYGAGLRGGLAGGIAMATVAIIYGVVATGSPWLPINLLAGILIPSLDGSNPEMLRSFHATGLLAASGIHLALSMGVGLVYAAVLPMLPGRPIAWGGIVAPVVWSAVAWASIGLIAPALSVHVNWLVFILSQIAFGVTAGYLISRQSMVETLQSMPLAERAGLEIAEREEPES